MSIEKQTNYAPDVVAFLEARLAEVRALCADTTQGGWKSWGMQLMADPRGTSNVDDAVPVANVFSPPQHERLRTYNMTHMQDWQPKKVLSLVDSYQRIIERYKSASARVGAGGPGADHLDIGQFVALGEVLIDLASLWREHPDWHTDWEVQ